MSAVIYTSCADEHLGARLRRERERRQIPLASIAENSKISVSLFEELERDAPSHWPSGIFRRAFIRAYANAIGLDAEEITKEFLARFPDPNDPDTALAIPPDPAVAPPPVTSTLRLTLAAEGTSFTHEALLRSARERLAAIACDLAVVLTIGLVMYAAVGTLWLPLCLALVGYYAGGVLILGNTPGVCLCAPRRRRTPPAVVRPKASRLQTRPAASLRAWLAGVSALAALRSRTAKTTSRS
jgi:transcriptional regulator with XRE-family HTH domain